MAMARLTYPVGEQNFAKIRDRQRVYIDKTPLIYRMITEGKPYFLSRPRRFGKSLLLTTLRYYFEGRRELFEGLAIDQLETEWKQHPVLLFDMSRDKNLDEQGLNAMLNRMLVDYEEKFEVSRLPGDTFASRVGNLIKVLHETTGQPVVVLVDEYDAPLLDVLDEEDSRMINMRNIMRGFYSPLKAMAEHLRFVMLTGITKFSQLSIFSELNNLKNISMQPEYEALCGITQEELETQLRPGIEDLAQNQNITVEDAIKWLKEYYDGYHFTKNLVDLYNPFSLIYALSVADVGSYWFGSGTPTWLVQQMRHFNTDLTDIEEVKVSSMSFDRPTERLTNAIPLLYQSGYLTIKDYDRESDTYTLGIPNKEVRQGLGFALSEFASPKAFSNRDYLRVAYFDLARHRKDIANFMEKLDTFYRSIPYDISNDNEKHFQAIFYATIAGYGADIMAEDRTSDGRADIVIRMPKDIYVVEMKYGESADAAMEQLRRKDYAVRWRGDGRPVHLLAINISKETRGVDGWLCE